VLFARESHFYGAASALLLVVSMPVVVHAEIGDHWAAKEANTPVFEGPDRSFRVQTYVEPDDVIRQQSNKKIRGFLKMLIPKENYATGYVLEEQVEFLGGMENGEDVAKAHRDKPKHAEDAMQGPQASGGFGWIAWTLIFLLTAAVASISWVLVRQRSPSSGSAANISYDLGSLKDQIARARKFFHHIRTRGMHRTDRDPPTPGADRSFIDDLLPADFDSQMENSGDPDHQITAGEEVMPDIEQVAKLYDLVLRQFESGRRVPALWAKAMTLAEGNEEAARCKYVQLLVARISEQRRLRQDSGST